MEDVMWILVDENNKIITQTLCRIIDEEKAIDTFALQGIRGKYKLGYLKQDGTSHMCIGYQIF